MVIELPPYRPFLLIFQVLVGILVAATVWFWLSIFARGLHFGPGERVDFASREEAVDDALFGAGPAWIGSRVHVEQIGNGYLIQRTWLGWDEVAIPATKDWTIDTANYEYGFGQRVKDAIVLTTAAIAGLLTFVAFRRFTRFLRIPPEPAGDAP